MRSFCSTEDLLDILYVFWVTHVNILCNINLERIYILAQQNVEGLINSWIGVTLRNLLGLVKPQRLSQP
jgi:hypothetical protein